MIRNVVIHAANEQPLMADLFDLPTAEDAGLLCTNVRMMDGKRPVFIDHIDSTFFFPYHVVRFLEIPKGGPFRDAIPSSVRVAWKPGGIEGVQTAWGLVDVPGAPYAVALMINYGSDDMGPALRELSAAVYRYFAQIARTTPYGVRVPAEVIRKTPH